MYDDDHLENEVDDHNQDEGEWGMMVRMGVRPFCPMIGMCFMNLLRREF